MSPVPIIEDIPYPPDYDRHIKTDYSFKEIWDWIGTKMFYNKILGYKGNFILDKENNAQKAIELDENVHRMQQYVEQSHFDLMHPKAMWQFFSVKKKENTILILNHITKEILKSIYFPRQKKGSLLSLSDYINPENDNIAFFVCTTGNKVSELANLWIDEGKYTDSFLLQGLALAAAESLAEIVHRDIRESWGFPDSPELTKEDIFMVRNRGCRYSFGYPACPNLEDQQVIWDLLHPKDIDVNLTEGFMMEPEASVSALVIHHPEAKYFSV